MSNTQFPEIFKWLNKFTSKFQIAYKNEGRHFEKDSYLNIIKGKNPTFSRKKTVPPDFFFFPSHGTNWGKKNLSSKREN